MDILCCSNFVTWEYWIVSWWCNTCIWQSSRPPTILKPVTKAAEQHHFISTKFCWPYIAGWNHSIFFVRAYRGWSNPITAVCFGFSWCIDCMRTFNRCLVVAGDLESSRSIGSITEVSDQVEWVVIVSETQPKMMNLFPATIFHFLLKQYLLLFLM